MVLFFNCSGSCAIRGEKKRVSTRGHQNQWDSGDGHAVHLSCHHRSRWYESLSEIEFEQTTTDDPDNTDESNDEIRMSNDQLMTKHERARGEQVPTGRDSPPSLGLRRYGLSDSSTDHTDSVKRARLGCWSLRLAAMDFSRLTTNGHEIDTNVVGRPPGHYGLDGCSNNDKIRMTK